MPAPERVPHIAVNFRAKEFADLRFSIFHLD
jgi:hypothetical protein